jgi:hypothetical protein
VRGAARARYEFRRGLAIALLKEKGVYAHPGHFYDFPSEQFLVLSLLRRNKSVKARTRFWRPFCRSALVKYVSIFLQCCISKTLEVDNRVHDTGERYNLWNKSHLNCQT